jgi:glycerophosphoryl diester phosphodiesterase
VSIGADFLSPVATAYASPVNDPSLPGYIAFTNKTMVDAAHRSGLQVKPWTPNRLNVIKYLMEAGVDGLITDYPLLVRRYIEQRNDHALAPLGNVARVQKCLKEHVQLAPTNRTI